jgi:adenosylhomocysteine nucleosidase
MALPLESGGAFEKLGIPVLYTGVGKVNATYTLTRELARHAARGGDPIDFVLNLGTAGSSVHAAGTLVECTRFIQRDMDARPLGFAIGVTPFDEHPQMLESSARFPHLARASCGSGDDFCIDYDASRFQVVDMEAYALAKVSHLEGIPFACVKYITDGADHADAGGDWQQASRLAGERLAACVQALRAGFQAQR